MEETRLVMLEESGGEEGEQGGRDWREEIGEWRREGGEEQSRQEGEGVGKQLPQYMRDLCSQECSGCIWQVLHTQGLCCRCTISTLGLESKESTSSCSSPINRLWDRSRVSKCGEVGHQPRVQGDQVVGAQVEAPQLVPDPEHVQGEGD